MVALSRNRLEIQNRVAPVRVADLEVDALRQCIQLGTREVILSPDEHILLYILVARAGDVITHRELAAALGQTDPVIHNNTIARHVSSLRRKLSDDAERPRYIETVAGVGYRIRVVPHPGLQLANASRNAPRILVLEDDTAVSGLLQLALCDDGYRVATADEGAAALGECAVEDPALILLDLDVPRMGGAEFLEAYRTRTPARAKVVVISGAVNAAEIARRIIADAFVGKPFDIEILLRTVRRLLPRFSTVDAA